MGILDLWLLLRLAHLVAVRGGVCVLDWGIRLQWALPIATRLAPVVPVVLVVVLMVGMFNVYNLVRKYAKRVPWSEKHQRKYQRGPRVWVVRFYIDCMFCDCDCDCICICIWVYLSFMSVLQDSFRAINSLHPPKTRTYTVWRKKTLETNSKICLRFWVLKCILLLENTLVGFFCFFYNFIFFLF